MNSSKPKKLITRNYGSIPHLSNSKLNQQTDKKIPLKQEKILTTKVRDRHDVIIATEKVDGCNAGIIKLNSKIYGVTRAGYDVRDSPFKHIRLFQEYIEAHKKRYIEMLKERERLCGEWMVKVHSLEYNLPHEPFIAFDLINSNNERLIYDKLIDICSQYDVMTAGLIHRDSPITIKDAMKKLGNGFHGCMEQAEGVVYKCERNGKVVFLAKYVRDKIDGLYMNNESKYNNYPCL